MIVDNKKISTGNVYKSGDIIGFQDFDNNRNIDLSYLQFLNLPQMEVYKIRYVNNYRYRNVLTNLGVWNIYISDCAKRHKILVKQFNEALSSGSI